MNTAPSPRSFARRAAIVATGTLALAATSVALAGPASAGVPEGWAPEDQMSWGHLWLIIAGIPLAAAAIISLLVLLPGVLRGERLIPDEAEHLEHPERPGRNELNQGAAHH